ncbi:hypothetical protein B0H34DRAFT_658132, partial [Crassisporium funariophilum]
IYRPANQEELVNLHHTSARNIVEQIFGVMKKHFGILTRPPQFSMAIQAKAPPGLAATHNFIMDHDPGDINECFDEEDLDPNPGHPQENEFGTLADGAVTQAEKDRATEMRNDIAEAMWNDYQ